MKKILTALLFSCLAFTGYGQGFTTNVSNINKFLEIRRNMAPFEVMARFTDTTKIEYYFHVWTWHGFDSSYGSAGQPDRFVWVNRNGEARVSSVDSLRLKFSNTTGLTDTLGTRVRTVDITKTFLSAVYGFNPADSTSLSNLKTKLTADSAATRDSILNRYTKAQTAALFQPAGSYLTAESDPVYSSSVASGITGALVTTWNAKQNVLTAGTDYLQPAGNGSALTGLTKSQVGLSSADNTSDAGKPVSTAQQTALNAKYNTPAGTTGQYIRGDGSAATFPTLYTPSYANYESIVSQSGGSAPTASRKDTNFGATTFTWARSGAGSYTLTASAPTFTAGKTVVVMSSETTGLQKYTAVVTNTTVITFGSAVQSVISLILSLTGTDGIFNNTLVDVRVYN